MRTLLAAVLSLVAWTAAAADTPTWRVSRAEVRVTCPLTVGGSFEARTTSLAGTLTLAAARPPAFSGELSVDLDTLDTGIALRNHHLRDVYLEVHNGAGLDRAVLSDLRLGDVDASSFQGRTTFAGALRLHGVQKEIAGVAEVRRDGSSVRVEASFPVTLADFGIAKPQYLGVGVRDAVQVEVSLVATLVSSAGGSR